MYALLFVQLSAKRRSSRGGSVMVLSLEFLNDLVNHYGFDFIKKIIGYFIRRLTDS